MMKENPLKNKICTKIQALETILKTFVIDMLNNVGEEEKQSEPAIGTAN